MWSVEKILDLEPSKEIRPYPDNMPKTTKYRSARVHPYLCVSPLSTNVNMPLPGASGVSLTAPKPLAAFLTPSRLKLFLDDPFARCGIRCALLSKLQLDQLCKPFTPNRTKINNTWAARVFKSWVTNSNVGEHLPEDMLEKRIIQKRTGHKSLDALHLTQEKCVSNNLIQSRLSPCQ